MTHVTHVKRLLLARELHAHIKFAQVRRIHHNMPFQSVCQGSQLNLVQRIAEVKPRVCSIQPTVCKASQGEYVGSGSIGMCYLASPRRCSLNFVAELFKLFACILIILWILKMEATSLSPPQTPLHASAWLARAGLSQGTPVRTKTEMLTCIRAEKSCTGLRHVALCTCTTKGM